MVNEYHVRLELRESIQLRKFLQKSMLILSNDKKKLFILSTLSNKMFRPPNVSVPFNL